MTSAATSKPTLIGLGGKLRSGKDTVADHLVEAHGFVKLGMSDALHEAMLALNPVVNPTSDEADEPGVWRYDEAIDRYGYTEAKERFPEIRRLLQQLGTEVGRSMFHPDVWTNIMAEKVSRLLLDGKSVAVTGIRFPNELAMINKFAGRTWWIERPSQATEAQASHASENGVRREDFKRTILNDSTLTELYRKVDELL